MEKKEIAVYCVVAGFVAGAAFQAIRARDTIRSETASAIIQVAREEIERLELPVPQFVVQLSVEEWAAIHKNTRTGGIQEAIDACSALLEPRQYDLGDPIKIPAQRPLLQHFDMNGANTDAAMIQIGQDVRDAEINGLHLESGAVGIEMMGGGIK